MAEPRVRGGEKWKNKSHQTRDMRLVIYGTHILPFRTVPEVQPSVSVPDKFDEASATFQKQNVRYRSTVICRKGGPALGTDMAGEPRSTQNPELSRENTEAEYKLRLSTTYCTRYSREQRK